MNVNQKKMKQPNFSERWMPDYQVENILALYDDNEIANLSGMDIELGCWQGYSTHSIVNHIYPSELQVVDHFLGNIDESATEITVLLAAQRNIEKEFKDNMKLLTKGNYKLHNQDCIAWLMANKEPIRFSHIDASHDYQSVFETIKLVKEQTVEDGIICGDDFRKLPVAQAVGDSFKDFETDGHNLWWVKHEV